MDKNTEIIENEKIILGNCILHHRARLKETQEEFAEACGLSTDTISLLERRQINPSLSTIICISAHIKIPVSDMLKEDQEEFEAK